MELVKVETKSRVLGVPVVSIVKSGVIRLSPIIKDTLKLKIGDRVGFYYDKDKPKEWSLKINDDDITLRNADTAKTALLANSSVVANKILASLGFVNKVTIRMALKPFKDDCYFALLTSSAKGE